MGRWGTMLSVLAALLVWSVPVLACGANSDCVLESGRTYRIALPEAADGPVGTILHAHGYKGSAAGAMGNTGLRALARRLGVAFIAADSDGDDWSLPHSPTVMRSGAAADLDGELAYFAAVLGDAARRFGIDRDRVMATGFSAGGMMVWTLACHRADLAAGFAPVSGTFWAPVPETCPAAPAHLIHTHGTADPVVPLEGRRIGPTKQGAVADALAMYRRDGDFRPAGRFETDGLACERWRNPSAQLLELCLHDGGHGIDPTHLERAWRTLERAGAFAAAEEGG